MERLCLLLLLLLPLVTTNHPTQLEKSYVNFDDKSYTTLTSHTCPNCLHHTQHHHTHQHHSQQQSHSDTDHIRLEAIKHQILMKLGLKHKPNVTHHLPKEVIMETLFRAEENKGFLGDAESQEDDIQTTSTRIHYQDQEFDDFYGRTSEIITFAEQGQSLNSNKLLEFRMSREQDGASGQELRVRAATLWLKVDLRRSHHHHTQCVPTIWVFNVKDQLSEDVTWLKNEEFDKMTELSATQSLDLSDLGWLKFDLTPTIRSWYSQPESSKLRLLIDCSGCCKPVHVNTITTNNNPNRPFLVVHTDPNSAKRVRRRALDCSGAVKNQCCKQRFYVSFKDLGWDDWVIAPNGYYANYCKGDCGNHRTPDTFLNYYTHIIEEIRKKHHLTGMQPCCAPLKFSSMSLIYFGPDSNIIKRDLPKMVVDECGCP